MLFKRYIPAAPLCDFVHDLWLYEDYVPSSHFNERILPSGTIELAINLRERQLRIYNQDLRSCRRFSGAVVSGAYSRSFVTDVAEERAIMGVHFKAAGAFPFLGVPPDDLADAHIDLENLWGRSARDLRERLCEATNPHKRFAILEKALLRNITRPLDHHWAVTGALDRFCKPRVLIRQVAKELGLSQRRLIEVFTREAGLSPKLFGRIQRFQRALGIASEDRDSLDWSQVSLHSGYFDQSHLIADFVEFCGLSPAEYQRQLTYLSTHGVRRKRNHIPLV